MGDLSPSSNVAASSMASLSAKILVATVIVVFFMLALLFVVHIYAKWYWSRNEDPRVVSWRRRAARQARSAARSRGLDLSALRSLAEVSYDPKEFKEGLECAVCLSEVSQGEKIRLLPKCKHGFHVSCIDMWFHSHATCPLCRSPVISTQNETSNANENDNNGGVEMQEVGDSSSSGSESELDDDHSSYASPRSMDALAFPTNVLFWGNETQVSSHEVPNEQNTNAASSSSSSSYSSTSSLVIDIPRELCEDCLASPPLEEAKSPVLRSLRSLKRLLSRGKKVAPSPRDSSSAQA